MEKLYGTHRKLIVFFASDDGYISNFAGYSIRPKYLADILGKHDITVKADDIPYTSNMFERCDYINAFRKYTADGISFKINQANCKAYLEWEKMTRTQIIRPIFNNRQ